MIKYNCKQKKFLLRFFVFILPLLSAFVFFDVLSIYVGELIPTKMIVEKQEFNKNTLFGRKAVDHELRRYKYFNLLRKDPEILALGSSRILQMNEKMFKDKSFYNAGSLAHTLGDLEDFFSLLPQDSNIKTIFLSVDYYWFGKKRENYHGLKKDLDKIDPVYLWQSHSASVRELAIGLFLGKYTLNQVLERKDNWAGLDAIGFSALEGNGFKSDGSYQYGTYLKEMQKNNSYRDREQPPIINRVRGGNSQFVANSDLDYGRIESLKNILEEAKNRGIKIIGILMPFSTEVYDALSNLPEQRKLFKESRAEIRKVFKEIGFSFYDFSNIKDLDLDDTYMYDGLHVTDGAIRVILDRISLNGEFM